MQKLNYLFTFLILSLFTISFTSCSKEEMKDPDNNNNPDIEVNGTIADLRAFHIPNQFITIDENLIVDAIVIANDSSGNFYRTLVVQDETGGIEIKIEKDKLYQEFPIGRKVYIKCKNLVISDDENLIELGGGKSENSDGELELDRIAAEKLDSFIVKGVLNQEVVSHVITSFDQLTLDKMSTLVTLYNVQLAPSDTFRTYADAKNQKGRNLTIQNCDGESVILRTSGFADFASVNVPDGNGTITGVFTIFGTSREVYIRNTSDVELTGKRCSGTGELPIPFTAEFDQGIPFGWTLIATTGDRLWEGRDYQGEFYAQMSAFSSSEGVLDITTWMITPEFDMEKQAGETIELKLADAFENGNPFKLMYSSDYIEGDPSKATWTEIGHDVIEPLINNPQGYDNVYESTGKIDISGLSGKVRFAFLYESGGTISTTIQLSTVIVE